MIGTPGKILALIKNNDLKLDNLKHFVIDEVDKMLDEIGKWKLNSYQKLTFTI